MITFSEQQCMNVLCYIKQTTTERTIDTGGGPCADFVGMVLNKISNMKIREGCLPYYTNTTDYQLIDSFDKFSNLSAGTILRVWEYDHFIHTAIKLTYNHICGVNGGDLLHQHLTKIQEDDFVYEHFAYRCIYYYAALLYVTAKDLFMLLKALCNNRNNQLEIDKILLHEQYIAAKLLWKKASDQSIPFHKIVIPENQLYKQGIDELCSEIDFLYMSRLESSVVIINEIITKYKMDELQEQYWDYVYRKVPFFCIDLYALKDNEMILDKYSCAIL